MRRLDIAGQPKANLGHHDTEYLAGQRGKHQLGLGCTRTELGSAKTMAFKVAWESDFARRLEIESPATYARRLGRGKGMFDIGRCGRAVFAHASLLLLLL